MAGERLASLVLLSDTIRPGITLQLWLAGAYHDFKAVSLTPNGSHAADEFIVLSYENDGLDAQAQQLAAQSLRQAIADRLAALSLPYVVTKNHEGNFDGAGLQNTKITATRYDRALDFLPSFVVNPLEGNRAPGLTQGPVLTTIRPVQVAQTVQDATEFGFADGTAALVASNGNDGVYTYFWSDGGSTASRSGLAAGRYTCTVTDTSGASTVAVVVVGSDARLDVLINRTDNNVTLVPSGGRAPYNYLWSDGATTAGRTALPVGTYTCTVTDSRGAQRVVQVAIDPYRFYWSQNPIPLSLDAGDAYRLDPTTKPGLSFVCEVWVEEEYLSGEFVLVGQVLEQPADRAGRTTFDVQALLDVYLREHLPELNQATISRATSQFRRFYLRSAEKFGTPPAAGPLSVQQQHYVVLGGLDYFEAAATTWFTRYQPGARPFLTWEPDYKEVLQEQPEYLYYMVDSFALSSFRLWVEAHFDDGTSTRYLVATQADVRRFEVYCLPAGYGPLLPQANLQVLYGGPRVRGWDVWVSDLDDVPQTERRHFVLSTDYVAHPRFFLYTNSLGGVGTFACTGQAKRTLEVKAEQADRALGVGYDALLGDTLTLDRTGTPVLNVSSPSSRAQLIALQDFYLSRRVVLQSGGQYWPGTVKAKTLPVLDESLAELPDVEFDFVLPRQRRFSARLEPAYDFYGLSGPVSGGGGAQP